MKANTADDERVHSHRTPQTNKLIYPKKQRSQTNNKPKRERERKNALTRARAYIRKKVHNHERRRDPIINLSESVMDEWMLQSDVCVCSVFTFSVLVHFASNSNPLHTHTHVKNYFVLFRCFHFLLAMHVPLFAESLASHLEIANGENFRCLFSPYSKSKI